GLTNALTSDAPIISALFYGKLYVATGGALQVIYTVRDIDLEKTRIHRRIGRSEIFTWRRSKPMRFPTLRRIRRGR
ncbi:MAG TPA: hypothetical protein PLV10_05550, partial [Candidatus Latescibacteria bacterium]|nr:hypothetical protein [Candidatus Latescibacterota bacterium]